DFAHRKTGPGGEPLRIIHRDVSPQNILISMEGEVKLTDFGLAKALAIDTHSASGLLKGKLAYMPPEQLRGNPLDARADIFSLGAVLYELLAGGRLYPQDLPVPDLVRRVDQADFTPLSERRPELDPALCAVVDRCLSPDAEQRWATAGELERTLRTTATRLGLVETSYGLADYMRSFEGHRRVVAEVQADGTVVSRRPIAALTEATADTIAAIRPGQIPPAATVMLQPAEPLVPELAPPRRWPMALLGVAAAALAWGLATSFAVSPSAPSQPSEPVVVTPTPTPAGETPRIHRLTEVSARSGRRAAAVLTVLPARIEIQGAGDTSQCFVRDVLRDEQREVTCAEAIQATAGPHRVVVMRAGSEPFSSDMILVAGTLTTVTVPPPVVVPVTCDLTLETEPPGAAVTLDGRQLTDVSPVAVTDIKAGEHTVALYLRGHGPAQENFVCDAETPESLTWSLEEHRLDVRVGSTRRSLKPGGSFTTRARAAGVNATFRVTATRTGARMTINSSPWATVVLDGTRKGDTPVTVKVGSGKHTIKLIREGQSGTVPVRITVH
ncbi:MAG: hypothetical protein ACI9WU_003834, partial [Myxococcota bacterium]